jgi:hypothetical protein
LYPAGTVRHGRTRAGRAKCIVAKHKRAPEPTMPDYTAPLQQMRFTIEHLADFKDVAAL